MKKESVTIRHVAQRAGVSVTTVSNVLNGNLRHVGEATRTAVRQAMDDLNYRPNAIARSMVRQTTATIGLVMSEIQNPVLVPVLDGVAEVLAAEGFRLVLAEADNVEAEATAIETLREQQVAGLLFMLLSYRYPAEHLQKLHGDGLPFVLLNRAVNDRSLNQVLFDDTGAALMATRHLLGLGHSRIGLISGSLQTIPLRQSAHNRWLGWRQALEGQNLEPDESWIFDGGYTFEGGYRAAQEFLARRKTVANPPTALFVANDAMAVGVLKAVQEAGVKVPSDLALVAIGDPPFAAYTYPALTTVALPVQDAGRRAAHLLLDWIRNGQPDRAQQITLNCSLVVRETCGGNLHR
jgi:LacI family transcriptional regulator